MFEEIIETKTGTIGAYTSIHTSLRNTDII